MEKISTPKAPAAIGPYSQAVKSNGLIFASGQIPIDPATGSIVDGGIEAQARQAFSNVRNILEAADATMTDVVKVTVFMADMADFAIVNDIYAEHFTEPYPARSAVAVKSLPKGALIEVEVIAEMR